MDRLYIQPMYRRADGLASVTGKSRFESSVKSQQLFVFFSYSSIKKRKI